MSKGILDIKSNFMYQVIFSVQDKEHGLKFPIEKVEQYLDTEGYKRINIESMNDQVVMIKDDNKLFITQKVICFEVLSEDIREKYNQKFTSFIILRYKIFLDATIQNIESAKINLIQNKLRTCVSNMYYSLHNGISAMVEYYKLMNDNTNLLEVINDDLDDEAFLGHFTPAAFSVLLENIDGICENDKEEYLRLDKMKSGRMKSENNPLAWIYPLFYDKISKVETADIELSILLEDMETAISDISLDNIAVDDSQKRSSFEKELKNSLEIVKCIIKEEEKNSTKYILAVLSGYFSYAYMLRQLGDYDSLFEIKVKQKEVIRWTITSSQFIDIILKYLKITENKSNNKIQIINARSSKETLNDLYTKTEMELMTITGIIIDRNFKLVEYIINLLKKPGYSLLNQNNEIPNYEENPIGIIVSKNILETPFKCFLTISNTGIFRIDVIISEYIYRGNKKTINTSYLEKFIHKEILEEDFQSLLSSKGEIVVGTSINYQNEEYGKYDLLSKAHLMFQDNYNRKLVQNADRIANDLYDKKNLVIPIINLFNESARFFSPSFVMKFKKITSNKENFNNNVQVIFIILVSNENAIDEDQVKRVINNIGRNEEIKNNIKVEYIKIEEDYLKQILYGEYSCIRNIFNNIIEKYEINRVNNLEEDLKEKEDDNKNIEDFEDIEIDIIEKTE